MCKRQCGAVPAADRCAEKTEGDRFSHLSPSVFTFVPRTTPYEFSSALWIALPMMALLLFVNLTMGVIARIAPQMNVFAVGFPVTLTVGMLGITATLPMMEQPFLSMIDRTLSIFGV